MPASDHLCFAAVAVFPIVVAVTAAAAVETVAVEVAAVAAAVFVAVLVVAVVSFETPFLFFLAFFVGMP